MMIGTRRQFTGSTVSGLSAAVFFNGISTNVPAAEAGQKSSGIRDVRLLSSGSEELPSMAADGNGNAWMVTLDWDCDGRQNIAFYRFREIWQDAGFVANETGSYETPVIACGEGGRPMVVWSCEKDSQWTLESAIYDGKSFTYSCPVNGPGRAANPALTAGVDNDYWLTWESYENGVFSVWLKQFKNGKWRKPIAISVGGPNSYDPAIAVSPKGEVFIAYTQADGPHRTVKLTSYDPQGDKIKEAVNVAVGGMATGKPNINTHPALAFDAQDRLWITWEARQVSAIDHRTHTSCYFGTRCCPVVCFNKGRIQKVAGSEVHVFKDSNDHKPTFVRSSNGDLWIFTRNSEEIRKWHVGASRLTSKGWSEPIALIKDENRGRGDKLAVAPGPGNTLLLSWQADNFRLRKSWFEVSIEEVKSQLYTARYVWTENQQETGSLVLESAHLVGYNEKNIGRSWQPRRKVQVGDQEYTLLWGNQHEHTNYSRCWSDRSDGDFDENYRYGLDVEGYDFIAITDHGYDLNEQRWRKSRRKVRFYNDPQRLVALPAFEWTLSGPDRPLGGGHRNVLFESDADAAKWTTEEGYFYHMHHPKSDRIDRVWKLLEEKGCAAVTIPHHPADKNHPMCWEHINHEYQMVVEIFQERRSAEYRDCPDHTYNPTGLEGCYVQDALAKGHKLGFVSGGDHNHMGTGVTALLVEEVSQAGVMEALRSRRCYGTSGDKIFIDFRINDAFMGQEVVVNDKPTIKVKIEAVSPLSSVVVFKNNQIIWQKNKSRINEKSNFDFTFTDHEFDTDSYYYVRAIQDNDQIAWSSPIWCTA